MIVCDDCVCVCEWMLRAPLFRLTDSDNETNSAVIVSSVELSL